MKQSPRIVVGHSVSLFDKAARWLVASLCSITGFVHADQVIISEIMYHSAGTQPEFVELRNISRNPRDMAKWKFTDGVSFTFPDFNAGAVQDNFLKAGEAIIVSSADAATTRAAYNISPSKRVFGPWTGSLDNSGERITVEDMNGVTLATVKYGTGGNWPKAADGTGHSLQIINRNATPDDWHNWKASPLTKGPAGIQTVVINYADSWKWNIPSSDPGTAWRGTDFVDTSWTSGAGLFGYETATLPAPIQTPLPTGNITHLFRKTFNYSGSTAGATIQIQQILDDGAIYYLNGTQIAVSRMDSGTAWNAGGFPTVDNATEEVITVPATGLNVGSNVFCAEVHNAGTASSDLVFGARVSIISGGGAASSATVRLSEVHFNATGAVDWVELQNTSGTSQDVSGLYLGSLADGSNRVALSGSVAANGFQSFTIPTPFQADDSGEVNVFLTDSANNVLGAADLTRKAGLDSIQAVWPVIPATKPSWQLLRTGPEWYSAATATQNAANSSALSNTSIVINEIMNDTLSEQEQGEYVELHNKSGQSVSLNGWRLRGGIDFDFPAGTSIAAGGYLVVGSNKAFLQANYPGVTIIGDWVGNLSNKADLLRLIDQNGNLADEVDYKSGGDWPDLSTNKGSSMELINPNMDNNRPSAWRASNESNKATSFETYTMNVGTWVDKVDWLGWNDAGKFQYIVNDRNQVYPPITNDQDFKEWHMFAVKDSHIIVQNVSLTPSAGGGNQLQNAGQISVNGNSNTGWLAQGTMGQSYMSGAELHMIADGHGDGTVGKLEIDCTGISPGTSYTLTFQAKWVSGVPIIVGQSWDRTMGGVFRISVPNNLGSAGAQNSRYNANPRPQVDSLLHSPAVPKSTESVKITARIYSFAGLNAVEALVRQDDINNGNSYQSFGMVDNGSNGDAIANDGVYTTTINNHQEDGRRVQFYVQATASNGTQNVAPPAGGNRPGMWIVDDLTRVDSYPSNNEDYRRGQGYPRSEMANANIRRQRFVMSEYDVDGLRSAPDPTYGGGTSRYGYRNPRMSNHYYPVTYIHEENDVYYLCEARQSGSQWHRSQSMSTFDRIKWKLPDDRPFRQHTKLYTDPDNTKTSGIDNHLSLYQAWLLGYPAYNEIELVRSTINNYVVAIRSETELTDNDLLKRAFKDGQNGQLVKAAEQVNVKDNAGNVVFAPIDLSYAYRGNSDNPVRWHGNFPLRSREWDFDYSAFTEMFKTWSNPSASTEQLERIIDVDEMMLMTAARGYAGDWDSVTYNGKNGAFYRRPTDQRWLYLHWDGDSAYEFAMTDTGVTFLEQSGLVMRDLPGFRELVNRPNVRRKLNYYLTEILNKYSKNSPRVLGWLEAQQTAVAGAFNYGNPKYRNEFWGDYPWQYTNFFSLKEPYVKDFINQAVGTGGVANSFTANFQINSNDGTIGPTVTLRGQAPSMAYSVVVDNHPEAVMRWDTQINFKLSGIVMASGTNNFTLRMVDKFGAQVGSSIPYSVSKSGNAAPIMDLNISPDSYNLELGKVATFDGSASYDPDAGALTFGWANTPANGVILTSPTALPANSIRRAYFSAPGIYSFTITGTDPAGGVTPLTREVSVANAQDYETFTRRSLSSMWTVLNMENKDSHAPLPSYSLYEKPGCLLMQVKDNLVKPLQYSNSQPTLLRNMPGSGDCAILADVTLETRKTGTFFTGLLLETLENAVTVKYAFGLNNGTLISAKRSTGGSFTDINGSQVSIGDNAKLRIRRAGTQLFFERRTDGVWSTLFTQTMPADSTQSRGGVFLSTSSAENCSVSVDYIMVVDPSNLGDSVFNNLRVTEVMYHPKTPGTIEFIELKNIGSASINLQGVNLKDGSPITGLVIGNVNLAAGAYGVVTNVSAATFNSTYPGVTVLGTWASGALSNNEETVILRDADGNPIPHGTTVNSFTYRSIAPWPTSPDGMGPSLEVINVNGDYNDPANWRASVNHGGSPGSDGSNPNLDSDKDGVSDATEIKFGTDPNSATSRLLTNSRIRSSGKRAVSFSSAPGTTYRVEYCDNLGAAWLPLTLESGGSTMTAVTGTTSTEATDNTLPANLPPKRFYRIVAL